MKKGLGRRSPTYDEAVVIGMRILGGELQHDIAADYGYNGGRISEVNTGKRHPGAMDEARRRYNGRSKF